jgi:hypothetical protein
MPLTHCSQEQLMKSRMAHSWWESNYQEGSAVTRTATMIRCKKSLYEKQETSTKQVVFISHVFNKLSSFMVRMAGCR